MFLSSYSADKKSSKTQVYFWIFECSKTFVDCIEKNDSVQNSIVNTASKFSVKILELPGLYRVSVSQVKLARNDLPK